MTTYFKAQMDRERLLNDLLNTGVMAALVGGFALSNLESGVSRPGWEGYAIYVASYTAVHASTCSALTSALLYREANLVNEDNVEAWSRDNRKLMLMPGMKFFMGVVCYLVSVIMLAWVDLAAEPVAQIITLVVGLGSMSTVIATCAVVVRYNIVALKNAIERATGIDIDGDGVVGESVRVAEDPSMKA